MFRSNRQMADACRVLLAPIGLAHLWRGDRPHNELFEVLQQRLKSSGELALVAMTLDIFNGQGKATVGDLVHRLDSDHIRRVGTLLVAIADGPEAVDRWIAVNRVVTDGQPNA
jgi:hypothetical protein